MPVSQRYPKTKGVGAKLWQVEAADPTLRGGLTKAVDPTTPSPFQVDRDVLGQALSAGVGGGPAQGAFMLPARYDEFVRMFRALAPEARELFEKEFAGQMKPTMRNLYTQYAKEPGKSMMAAVPGHSLKELHNLLGPVEKPQSHLAEIRDLVQMYKKILHSLNVERNTAEIQRRVGTRLGKNFIGNLESAIQNPARAIADPFLQYIRHLRGTP